MILIGFGCHRGTDRDTNAIQKAMSSLIYAGDAPDQPSPVAGDHGSVSLEFPKRLLNGKQYIYHRKRDTTQSWVVIENALRANGAEIIDAPRGNTGLLYAYVGGPFFVIEFRMGRLHCSIQNHMARELESGGLNSQMEPYDYVLKIK